MSLPVPQGTGDRPDRTESDLSVILAALRDALETMESPRQGRDQRIKDTMRRSQECLTPCNVIEAPSGFVGFTDEDKDESGKFPRWIQDEGNWRTGSGVPRSLVESDLPSGLVVTLIGIFNTTHPDFVSHIIDDPRVRFRVALLNPFGG